MMRETLAYRVHRALGVTVPRHGYARIYVNDEYYGLYSMLEPVDELFASRTGGSRKDVIFEGEQLVDAAANHFVVVEEKDPDSHDPDPRKLSSRVPHGAPGRRRHRRRAPRRDLRGSPATSRR